MYKSFLVIGSMIVNANAQTLEVLTHDQKVYSSVPETGAGFGRAFDLRGDILVSGSTGADEPAGSSNVGMVEIYKRSDSNSDFISKFTDYGPASNAEFAESVAIGTDWVAVSDPFELIPGKTSARGRVYMYKTTDGGETWSYDSVLQPPEPIDDTMRYYFGNNVEIDVSDTWLMVAALGHNDGTEYTGTQFGGAVHFF